MFGFLGICPKHWQLPKNKVDRVYVEGEGDYGGHWEARMVDNSYQALLGSYGWKINADKVYGPNVWADGTSTYNNRLEPFYLTGAGMILAGTLSEGMRHAGPAGFTWSSATTSMTMNGSMTIAGATPSGLASDTLFLAGTNYGRSNAFSLRCLTQ